MGKLRSIKLPRRLIDPQRLWQEYIRRFIYPACMILSVIVIGTCGYMLIQGWSVFDSLYMTVITIGTVGFKEIGELSHAGKAFTILLIFLGIGVGGYSIATIAAVLVEGHVLDIVKGRRMVKEITGLRNHVIVCGFGKIGREVCACLAAANEDFIVVDTDHVKIEEALGLGYLAAVGEATDDDILLKCGIQHARGLISAISDDSANVFLVLTARALNDKLRIIARGVGEASAKKMARAGADRVVSPYEIGARRMSALMLQPDIVDFLEAFSPGTTFGLRLEKVELHPSSALAGKQLSESYIKRDTKGALVLAVEKPGQPVVVNPPGDITLAGNDVLLVIGNDAQIALLQKMAR